MSLVEDAASVVRGRLEAVGRGPAGPGALDDAESDREQDEFRVVVDRLPGFGTHGGRDVLALVGEAPESLAVAFGHDAGRRRGIAHQGIEGVVDVGQGPGVAGQVVCRERSAGSGSVGRGGSGPSVRPQCAYLSPRTTR